MKLYIFDAVDPLTMNYHSGGGCVVIADSLERAKELVPAGRSGEFVEIGPMYEKPRVKDWPSYGTREAAPGYYMELDIVREGPDYADESWLFPEPEVFDLDDQVTEERVWVFPDAGCC